MKKMIKFSKVWFPKMILFVSIIFFALTFSAPATTEAAATVTIGSQSASNGQNINVPVTATNFTNNVGGIDFTIQYDPALLSYTSITQNEISGHGTLTVGTTSNTIIVNWFDNSALSIDSGTILTLNFAVISSSNTTTNLSFSGGSLSDGNGDPISPTSFVDGVITLNPVNTPTVTTQAASSITATGATGNGNITSIGGSSPTVRGVAYGLTASYGATTTEAGSFSTGAFTASMTGLTCNTTYHYRAYAANTSGTSTGSDVTFTTSPCAPTVVTSAASSVTMSTVTLNGSISATGGANATQSGFAYGTSASLSTTIATSSLGAQTGTASFNEAISGLTPSTTYYFRAYATNSAGTSTGSILSFTTSAPGVPTVTTQSASSITATTATGNGNITSTGGVNATVRGVAYGLTTAYGATTTENGSFSTGAFTASMTGLTCNTTYHYRAYAANTSGTSTGSDVTFTTSPCVQTVVTSAASSVTTNTATLNGSISSTGGADATQSGFAYGTSATLATTIATSTLGAQTGTASFNEAISGLTPSTTYYFRAYTTNSAGTSYGLPIVSFTTSAPGSATVTTQSASSITATTATGNGNITSTGGVNATVRGVAYGLTTAYGATTTENGSFSTGAFTASMTGLTCNTTYHYRAYAVNTVGTSTGSDTTFTTGPCVPTVVTSAASSITPVTVTLNGSISNTGGANASQSGFAYGTSATLATTIATSTLGAQTGTASFNEAISGLTPSTTYYFRAYATNSAGTSYGTIQNFTTSAPSVPGAPTIGTATAGDTTASVTFTVPLNDGGSVITYYTVISSPSSIKAHGDSSPITVSGLTNGQAYTFTVKATNSVGTSSASSASNSVTPQIPAPTVTISASPTSVSSGAASNITWSSTNASTCTTTKAGVDWDYSTSNSVTSGPLTSSTIFTISCTGAGGSSSDSVTVNITSSGGNTSGGGGGGGGGYVPFTPTMTITANPTTVVPGASSIISWSSTMLGSCFITKAGTSWYVGTSTSGSKSSGPISSPTTFSALCGGSSGVVYKSITINVAGMTVGQFNTNLSMGTTHSDVTRLQQFLNSKGYIVSSTGNGSIGQESNYFGLKTKQALIRFQSDNHIVPSNGMFGPITRSLVNGLIDGSTTTTTVIVPSMPMSATTTAHIFTRNLTVGSIGTDVKALQVYLNSHGSPVSVSGPGSIGQESSYFGIATKNALAKFQKAHNIEPAEGYFGQITRTFINNN